MTAPTAQPGTLAWWQAGETFLAATADRLPDADLDSASLLPGWSRKTVLAHLAANADALVNLLTWAQTGVEIPMYASAQARDEGIAANAALTATDLRVALGGATTRFGAAIGAMTPQAWNARVRTAQGRTVPAAEVPWMRSREVWVHAIDLDAGAAFGDIPDDVLSALVDDAVATWDRRGQRPDVRLSSGNRSWTDGRTPVRADLPLLAAYVTGRHRFDTQAGNGPLPDLPAWL
jgi:maleylpyruvate isomerase